MLELAGWNRRVLLFYLVLGGVATSACGPDDSAEVSPANGGYPTSQSNVGGQSSSTGGGQSYGGQSTRGGASGLGGTALGGQSSSVGPTTQCPTWPRERLFPWVGLFFYGPNPGPCSRTTTSAPNVASSVDGTYDFAYDAAGLVIKIANRDGSNTYEYTRDQGLVASELRTTPTAQTTTAYHYAANTAGYTTASGSVTISSYEYTLDAQGYPLSITPMSGTATAVSAPARYEFQYDGCRFVKRIAYLGNGTADDTQTQTYVYDGAGRIVEIVGHLSTDTFDYSCW